MFDTIYNAAVNTPWWVYVLLIVLIQVGIKASKTGTVPLGKLFIAPIIFTAMAIETLLGNIDLTTDVLIGFAVALLIGIGLGWWQVSMQSLRVDANKKLIEVPGTWTVMVLVIIIFATKYYFGYELSVDPYIIHNTWFEVVFVGVTALCSGVFIGKLGCYMKRLYKDPQTTL